MEEQHDNTASPQLPPLRHPSSSSSYEPQAPPPSAPPPPLPPSTTSSSPKQQQTSSLYSYQRAQSSSSSYQSQSIHVTNYHDDVANNNNNNGVVTDTATATNPTCTTNKATILSSFRGDATVRPNIGQVNALSERGLFVGRGQALVEHVWTLQLSTLVVCCVAIILQLLALMGNVLELHLDGIVLGGYLLFLTTLLALYQVHTPILVTVLTDNVGILCRPLGRVLYLLLLAGLCCGQSWIPLYVVGGLYVWLASYTLYLYVQFPTFRTIHEQDSTDDGREFQETDLWMAAKNRAMGRYSWAQPEHVSLLASANLTAAAATATTTTTATTK